MISRRWMGWLMGTIGVGLIVLALLLRQGAIFQEPSPQEVGLEPTPVVLTSTPTVTPVVIETVAIETVSPTDTPGAAVLSPLGQSSLAQPTSPLGVQQDEDAGLVWLPTVVADANFESEPDEEPETPEEPQGAPVYEVREIMRYPHDPTAFTQGLEFRDGELYESTGLYGQSSLRRVDLETGTVLQQVDLPDQYFGEGITVFEDRIFQLTWQSHRGFIYERATFEQTGIVTYTTQGWGLTHDGERLIMSDGTATITFRDPETFDALEQIQVTDAGDLIVRLNELEYIEGEIWANVWLTDRIARIDAETGVVNSWLDLAALYPDAGRHRDAVVNGIAYDAETGRIFVTGKLWPYLFEIEVMDESVQDESAQDNPGQEDS